MYSSKLSGEMSSKKYYVVLILITLVAFVLRVINITYASLWSDELYSMLSVHPENSLYELLYMQRKDQPPLYFVLLRYWTMLFGFNDLGARSLSVMLGTLSVFAIGFTGRSVMNAKTGLVAAFITSFGFVQIEYSLEVRFYALLFLLVTCSLYTYWLISKRKPALFIYVIHAGLCASIILTHHFGALVVLGYLVFDAWQLVKERFQRILVIHSAVIWITMSVILAPWILFVYSSVSEGVRGFWLKEIDIPSYLLYDIQYNTIMLMIILSISLCGLNFLNMKKERMLKLLLIQVLLVIMVPILISYIFFPILVPRYALTMAPPVYLLLASGIVAFSDRFKEFRVYIILFMAVVLSYDGIKASFIDKDPLRKEPWREMAQWLRSQPDFPTTPLYSTGYQLKKRFTIDYYLPEKKAINIRIDTSGLAEQKRFYLVETNAHDVLPSNEKEYLKSLFNSEEIKFGKQANGKGGTITIFTAR
jgi:uncharacterized membrane protein